MKYELSVYAETWAGESPYNTRTYDDEQTALAVVKRLRSLYLQGLERLDYNLHHHGGLHIEETWAISKESGTTYNVELYPRA